MKVRVMSALALAGTLCCFQTHAQSSGSSWPGGFEGKLEPVELVWAIVSTGQPQHRGLAVDFKLSPIEEGRTSVEEEALRGLPFDQTESERQANRTSVVINMPYEFSDTAQNDPAGLQDLVEHVASQLDRFRVPGADGSAAEATCSGLRPGTEWAARATDARCQAMTEVTYRCTLIESESTPRGLWLRSESKRSQVASDLASYCR